MQIRYRIQSFSSQNQSFPISNLLSKHSPWESARFSDYPQEITISFYQPVKIQTIKIASHPTKIPSRINILYHLPEHQDKGFRKYGFITFSEGEANGSNNMEVKELNQVGIRAMELRFIILKNHMNKNNFFNQVGITFLNIIGTPFDHVIPTSPNNSTLLSFDPQINILNQLKNSLVKKQQFQEAKQVKNVLSYISKAGLKLNELQSEKQRCIREQDFLGAKKMKEEMLKFKLSMSDVVSKFYDPERQTIKSNKSDTLLKHKLQQFQAKSAVFNLDSYESKSSVNNSRIKEGESEYMQEMQVVSQEEGEEDGGHRGNQTMLSHEERIVPAVLSKIKGMGQTTLPPDTSQVADNEFFQDNANLAQLPAQPEALSPSDEANSSLLTEFYDTTFIKKLHSKFWQFKLQALTQVLTEISTLPPNCPKNRLRSLIFIYSTLIPSHNYQIAHSALELMNGIVTIKPQGDFKNELHNELQNSIKMTIKKLNDSNQKIKNQAEKTLLKIIQSQIFGVSLCYQTIAKSYSNKVNPKVRKIKIQNIEYMVQKYGIGESGVPLSVVEFSLKAANDQDAEVRKSAINLAKSIKERGGKQRLESLLYDSNGIKPSISKQILS